MGHYFMIKFILTKYNCSVLLVIFLQIFTKFFIKSILQCKTDIDHFLASVCEEMLHSTLLFAHLNFIHLYWDEHRLYATCLENMSYPQNMLSTTTILNTFAGRKNLHSIVCKLVQYFDFLKNLQTSHPFISNIHSKPKLKMYLFKLVNQCY